MARGLLTMLNHQSSPLDALRLLGDSERTLYEKLVPEDHFLRRLLQAVDFESFRPLLASAYCPDQGRPSLDPVVLFKLEALPRHHRLSDPEVIDAGGFPIAFPLFLALSPHTPSPH